MKLMDMHNHSNWSDGDNDVEEIILNGIKNGLNLIGISDHFETSKCNSIHVNELNSYIKTIESMKQKYKDKITILSGIEICLNKDWCKVDCLPFEQFDYLDYVLFEYVDIFENSVTLEEIENYTCKVKCKKGLAHTNLLDLSEKYGIDKLLKLIKHNNLFWEINVNEGYEYFDYIIKNKEKNKVKNFLKKLNEYKIEITVGSDTHNLIFYEVDRIFMGNKLAQEILFKY
jgi:histidinol phosphatase-like PHP family hydrolase